MKTLTKLSSTSPGRGSWLKYEQKPVVFFLWSLRWSDSLATKALLLWDGHLRVYDILEFGTTGYGTRTTSSGLTYGINDLSPTSLEAIAISVSNNRDFEISPA